MHFALLLFVIAGCKSADPDGTFAVAYADPGRTSFQPGEVVALTVTGADSSMYEATLGDTNVILGVTSPGELAILVPPVPSGQHTLRITSGDRVATVALALNAYDPIIDPIELITQVTTELDGDLVALLAVATDADVQANLTEQRRAVADALAQANQLPPEAQAQLAYILRWLQTPTTAAARQLEHQALLGCPHNAEFIVKSAAAAPYAAAASILFIVGAIDPEPFTKVLVFAGGTLALVKLSKHSERLATLAGLMVRDCLFVDEIAFGTTAASRSTPAPWMAGETFDFENKVQRTFAMTTRSKLDREASSLMAKAHSMVQEFATALPKSWLAALAKFNTIFVAPGAPTGLHLGAVNGSLDGTFSRTADGVALEFAFHDQVNQPPSPEAFSFELALDRSVGLLLLTQSATLAARCATGEMRCADGCVNTQTSRDHCGACDNGCSIIDFGNGAAFCSSGACSCAAGLSYCADVTPPGGCYDLATEREHCGTCGMRCGGGGTCVGGSCIPP